MEGESLADLEIENELNEGQNAFQDIITPQSRMEYVNNRTCSMFTDNPPNENNHVNANNPLN